jgi:prevent-host-death family protein
METVDIYEAKTRLSQLVEKAASGEDVVVSRNGEPLARITQLASQKRRITFGVLKGKVKIAADFDAPLTNDVLPGSRAADAASAQYARLSVGCFG